MLSKTTLGDFKAQSLILSSEERLALTYPSLDTLSIEEMFT